MQRNFNNPPPAQSPPLHHPIPQHVSTVPQLRSPPPLSSQPHAQAQNSYGYGQQPVQSGQYVHPAFGGFINDPTAQMGFQVGKTAVMAGQEYVEQNFNRYFKVSALKHYFHVSNSYVVAKLFLIIFPWRHRPWTRRQTMVNNGQEAIFLPPREDINSPDMYIPVMAFVTYILLSALIAGLRGMFHPELLGLTATTAFAVVIFEIIGLKIGCYLLSISNDSQLLDLVAYSGYKFVGIIVTIVVGEIGNRGAGTGGWVGWIIFFYTFLALAFFLFYRADEVSESATLFEIRSSTREFPEWLRRDCPSTRPSTEKVADRISVFLFLCCAVLIHVDTEQRMTPTWEQLGIALETADRIGQSNS